MTDERSLDLRDALRRAELERDEALNQLAAEREARVKAERLAERATRFDCGDGVTIARVQDTKGIVGWYVHRVGDREVSPCGDMLSVGGEWAVNLGDCHIAAHRFQSSAAAFAALDAVRADKGSK